MHTLLRYITLHKTNDSQKYARYQISAQYILYPLLTSFLSKLGTALESEHNDIKVTQPHCSITLRINKSLCFCECQTSRRYERLPARHHFRAVHDGGGDVRVRSQASQARLPAQATFRGKHARPAVLGKP